MPQMLNSERSPQSYPDLSVFFFLGELFIRGFGVLSSTYMPDLEDPEFLVFSAPPGLAGCMLDPLRISVLSCFFLQ